MKYSFVIPIHNRPDHMQKLLESLTKQTLKNFEVIVVEGGSTIKSDKVVESFADQLDIRYIYKSNEGQGFSRNMGMKNASGDYFVILDSDVIVPQDYLEIVDKRLNQDYIDAYGGPDALHPESTTFQTAVNHCMTSFFTTGGTRGKKSSVGQYFPRSFNMGVSRAVYEKTNGYKIPFMGEDIEWSSRIISNGFRTDLIPDAHVYHERKDTLKGFFRQIKFFGRSRMNIYHLIPATLKPVHFIPVAFSAYLLLLLLLAVFNFRLFAILVIPLLLYMAAIFFEGTIKYKNPMVGLYSVVLTFALMIAYSIGMIQEAIHLFVLRKEQNYKL